MNRMNADEEDVMFMDMKWTAILQLAQEDWESKFPIFYSLSAFIPSIRGSNSSSGSGRDSLQHPTEHKSHRR